MESHGGDEVDEAEELSPGEALASTKAARETLARRVSVPWTWDAFMSAGLGAYLCLLAEPRPWWTYFLIAPWPFALILMKRARQRRVGVAADGATSRTRDSVRWWTLGVVLAVLVAGWTFDWRWEHARLGTAVLAAAIVFAGFRWLNHRLVARIRNAS